MHTFQSKPLMPGQNAAIARAGAPGSVTVTPVMAPLMAALSGCVFRHTWLLSLAVGTATLYIYLAPRLPSLRRATYRYFCIQQTSVVLGYLVYVGAAYLLWRAAIHAGSAEVASVLGGAVLVFVSFSAWLYGVHLRGAWGATARCILFGTLAAAVPLLLTQ